MVAARMKMSAYCITSGVGLKKAPLKKAAVSQNHGWISTGMPKRVKRTIAAAGKTGSPPGARAGPRHQKKPPGKGRLEFPEQSARRIGELTRRAADTDDTHTSGGKSAAWIGGNRAAGCLGTFLGMGGSSGRSVCSVATRGGTSSAGCPVKDAHSERRCP